MMLYFFPESIHSDIKQSIKNQGVKALEDAYLTFRGCRNGPQNSGPGVVAAEHTTPDELIGFYADQQKWRKFGEYFIGYNLEHPPTPKTLQRATQLEGHPVKLADGHDWIIPIIRRYPAGTALPQAIRMDENGKIQRQPIPRHAEIQQAADTIFDAFIESTELSDEYLYHVAAQLLNFNYRLWHQEISFLELLDTDNIMKIMGAMLDFPTILAAYEKKNTRALEPSTTNAGETA